ncbi:MAG: MlaD family protein, partial [Planctomycetota bacterium]
MSKKSNPAMIGIFVLGALVLGVAGIIILGGGLFFAEEIIWAVYFDSSLKGLEVGAPMSFRGVPVGSVKEIVGIYDPEK